MEQSSAKILFHFFPAVHRYEIHVYTGDVKSAGTDANVFLTMFGENGDTGERPLSKSELHKDKFERGQVWKSSDQIIFLKESIWLSMCRNIYSHEKMCCENLLPYRSLLQI